jgi:hypothetical protein
MNGRNWRSRKYLVRIVPAADEIVPAIEVRGRLFPLEPGDYQQSIVGTGMANCGKLLRAFAADCFNRRHGLVGVANKRWQPSAWLNA